MLARASSSRGGIKRHHIRHHRAWPTSFHTNIASLRCAALISSIDVSNQSGGMLVANDDRASVIGGFAQNMRSRHNANNLRALWII